jgi:hypothetical protein
MRRIEREDFTCCAPIPFAMGRTRSIEKPTKNGAIRRRMAVSNERKVEVLKVWYALFTTIMDTWEDPAADIERLKKLRNRLAQEDPELEAEIQKEHAN